jgi:hypothetical protein
MSLDEHRRGFAVAMAVLIAEFNAYLDQKHADPTADSVGYRQIPLWLNQDELAEVIGGIHNLILSRMSNEPTPDRSLHLPGPILFPIEGLPPHKTDDRRDRARGESAEGDV